MRGRPQMLVSSKYTVVKGWEVLTLHKCQEGVPCFVRTHLSVPVTKPLNFQLIVLSFSGAFLWTHTHQLHDHPLDLLKQEAFSQRRFAHTNEPPVSLCGSGR